MINAVGISGVFRLRRASILALKATLAAGVLLLCWHMAAPQFADFDGLAFWAYFSDLSIGTVLLALLATALSYTAISCYDVIAMRSLGLSIPRGKAMRTGATATALGQFLGFGLIVGAFVRWRLLRQDDVSQPIAAATSAIVAAGFFSGLMVLGGVAAIVWPTDISVLARASPDTVSMVGTAIAGIFALILLAGLRGESFAIFGRSLSLPAPRFVVSQVGLAAIDVFFAAAVLWLLMPDAAAVKFGAIFVAYIGVLAMCLLANAPSGVGPLEGALLFALPDVPVEALLAGIVAFRLLYYLIPGTLGFLVLLDGETGGRLAFLLTRLTQRPAPPIRHLTSDDRTIQEALACSGRAEDELAHLGDKCFLPSPTGNAFLMFRRQGRALVAIGDPIGAPTQTTALCERFRRLAARERRTPVFYKIGPALAHAAKSTGLQVDRVGHEAVIDLASFTIAGSARREIRRKTRQAAKAGVIIVAHARGQAPLASFASISAEWLAARRASEASFSMGTCRPSYLRRFPIYEAQIEGRPVAFLSLWRSGDGQEWSIDVMRYASNAPPGTMHALIVAACDGARAAGATKFNLCVAPLSGLSTPNSVIELMGDLVFRHAGRFHHLQGLHRFKAAFKPNWHPRYVARHRGLRGLYGLWAVSQLICASETMSHDATQQKNPTPIAPPPHKYDVADIVAATAKRAPDKMPAEQAHQRVG